MIVDELEKMMVEYLLIVLFLVGNKLFVVLLYCIFIFNNLIGFVFLEERCK